MNSITCGFWFTTLSLCFWSSGSFLQCLAVDFVTSSLLATSSSNELLLYLLFGTLFAHVLGFFIHRDFTGELISGLYCGRSPVHCKIPWPNDSPRSYNQDRERSLLICCSQEIIVRTIVLDQWYVPIGPDATIVHYWSYKLSPMSKNPCLGHTIYYESFFIANYKL